jgi:type IV pilus assembly protein PilB
MVDMGVPGYLVASSVIGILGQRLVRVICKRCRAPLIPSEAQLEQVGVPVEVAKKANFSRGRGCNYCQKKGFRGRLGVFELMMVTGGVREMIFNASATQEIRTLAINEGMSTMYVDGIRKAMNGVTTLEEVFRVTKRTEQDVLDF